MPPSDCSRRAGPVDVTHDETLTWIRARAEWTTPFAWHEMPDLQAVDAADPSDYPGGPHYLWAWIDQAAGRLRSRMFAPDFGIIEDEATGAAAIAFTDLQKRDLDITQGTGIAHPHQMGGRWLGEPWRPSRQPAVPHHRRRAWSLMVRLSVNR